MNDNLSPDQFGYTVVTYHEGKNGKPRAKTRGQYEYDEDANEAARKIAAEDGSVLPNGPFPDKHPRFGEYSQGIRQHGNTMAAIYLKGQSKYRNG